MRPHYHSSLRTNATLAQCKAPKVGAQILHLACVESTAFCVQTGKCPIESVSVSPEMSPGTYKIVTKFNQPPLLIKIRLLFSLSEIRSNLIEPLFSICPFAKMVESTPSFFL